MKFMVLLRGGARCRIISALLVEQRLQRYGPKVMQFRADTDMLLRLRRPGVLSTPGKRTSLWMCRKTLRSHPTSFSLLLV